MRKILPYCCLALLLFPGCLFSKRSSRPKENTSITGEVQDTFRKRWLDKRTAELVAQGRDAAAARAQAETEFSNAYDFSKPRAQR